jgi:hypothetical protein
MHGQYFISIDRQFISDEDMFLWLSRGDVKTETASEIVAAQGQSLQTKMLQMETNRKYRLCQQFDETVDHIISACPI